MYGSEWQNTDKGSTYLSLDYSIQQNLGKTIQLLASIRTRYVISTSHVSSSKQTSLFKRTHLRLKQGAKDKPKPKNMTDALPEDQIPNNTLFLRTIDTEEAGASMCRDPNVPSPS